MIVLVCPFNSPPLRSNKRLHHMAEHRIKRDIRQAGLTLGAQEVVRRGAVIGWMTAPITIPVRVRLVWSVPTKHRRDADSAQPTLKAFQDGLVDAGLLAGDHWEIVRQSYCVIEYSPYEPMSVRVEIEAVI